ncbi:MAG TPA: YncE family protein, partial [Terriglobia bacterium]|nr:YncE family protein [Terriglobia bacterium]
MPRNARAKVLLYAMATVVLVALIACATSQAANETAKLYVTNSQGDDITVIDLATMRAVADIKVGDHVHGICAPAGGRELFTTIESENNLKVIDTATNAITATIRLTGRPNQCGATPDGRFVAVPIRDGNSVDILGMNEKRVVKVLPVKVPHNAYNAGSNDRLYVSSMGSHEIDLIDLKKLGYAARIPVGGIPRPYAVSRDGKRIYVALTDLHGFAIAGIPEKKVISRVNLPPAPPSTCALEPHTPTHGLELSPDGRELWV